MLRDKLEPKIDYLLGIKLRDPHFVQNVLAAHEHREKIPAQNPIDSTAIASKLVMLKEKRQRVLGTFFDGVIDKIERDAKLAEVERESTIYQQLLNAPTSADLPISSEDVRLCIEPFAEWEYLGREDKRSLLTAFCPQINISQYKITSIALNPIPALGGNDDSRSKTVPSRLPAPRFP
jgi:hypothetical protein